MKSVIMVSNIMEVEHYNTIVLWHLKIMVCDIMTNEISTLEFMGNEGLPK